MRYGTLTRTHVEVAVTQEPPKRRTVGRHDTVLDASPRPLVERPQAVKHVVVRVFASDLAVDGRADGFACGGRRLPGRLPAERRAAAATDVQEDHGRRGSLGKHREFPNGTNPSYPAGNHLGERLV
eukprot:5346708-Prymnesium_polylepis.1